MKTSDEEKSVKVQNAPSQLPCPQCGGELKYEGNNPKNTVAFIKCAGKCGFSFIISAEQEKKGCFRGYPHLWSRWTSTPPATWSQTGFMYQSICKRIHIDSNGKLLECSSVRYAEDLVPRSEHH